MHRFVERHLSSVSELEVLLLLSGRPGEPWDAGSVARAVRIEAAEAEAVLERLARQRLVRPVDHAYYCFEPGDPELAFGVRELAEVYPAFRVAIISVIFSRRPGADRPTS